MLFFSTVIAPSVFQVLDERAPGQFLRTMFPKYFAVNGLVALLAALLAFRPLGSDYSRCDRRSCSACANS